MELTQGMEYFGVLNTFTLDSACKVRIAPNTQQMTHPAKKLSFQTETFLDTTKLTITDSLLHTDDSCSERLAHLSLRL